MKTTFSHPPCPSTDYVLEELIILCKICGKPLQDLRTRQERLNESAFGVIEAS